MKATALWCAVLLLSCHRQKADPRLFEVKTPVHVTVRNIDAPKPVDCDAAGDWKEQFSCTVAPAPRIGCAYVEVGTDADTPIIRKTSPSTPECASLGGARVMLQRSPGTHVELEFDSTGSRGVLRVDATQWVLFMQQGQLVRAEPVDRMSTVKRGPDGLVIWNTVPTVLSLVPMKSESFSDEAIDDLFANTPDAQRAYNEAFAHAAQVRLMGPEREEWPRLYARLDEAGRNLVRDALLVHLREGEAAALSWLEADAQLPRDVFINALVAGLSAASDGAPMLFDALFRLDTAQASTVACDQLENNVLGDDGIVGAEGFGTVLALIAKYKVKCPWVGAILEASPCDASLRRDSFENEDESHGNLPLATAQEKARALKLKFTAIAEMEEGDEDFVSDGHDGWLLMAAADVQGPLPEVFVKKNARRMYRRVERFDGVYSDNPCIQTSTPPAEWACRMPLWLTTVEHQGCRVDIDDAARTLTLTGVPGYMKKKRADEAR